MPSARELLDRLWDDYASLNPQARAIHDLLVERGERVVNDHIALRTYDDARVNIDVLARGFVNVGYKARDDYTFPEKKLVAKHFEHADRGMPKVFISELQLGAFSDRLGKIVDKLLAQIEPALTRRGDLAVRGRPWRVSFADYEALGAESEYAAWVAAFGFRANHFTVDVGALANFPTLAAVNAFIRQAGFKLNASGGEIKGSPQVYLEQSSTLADQVSVQFSDGPHTIPACYYEFAKRYTLPDGRRFEGFVAKSADKIFQSTDRPK